MKVFHSIEEYRQSEGQVPLRHTAVTLGKFDGIHIGHRKLIRRITDEAKRKDLDSVVLAIEIKGKYLLSHQERAAYLESLGVDVLLECPFSKHFMNMEAQEFVRSVLSETLHASYVSVGIDFTFGRNRSGNASDLKKMGARYGFETLILDKEKCFGEDVSSTRVRRALEAGDMALVKELLGRPYPVQGIVEHGRHIGNTIGFPTLNVIPEQTKILPPDGVYASLTTLEDGEVYTGLSNVGMRPTVGGDFRNCETTLFGFDRDIYGQMVRTDLHKYIRPEKKFSGLEELKEQIRKDCEKAREFLVKCVNGVDSAS